MKFIFTLVFTCLLQISCFGQRKHYQDTAKYYCKYLFTYQLDSTDAINIGKEKMVLLIGDNFSKFSSMRTFLKDSLLDSNNEKRLQPEQAMAFSFGLPKTKFPESINKLYLEDRMIFSSTLGLDKFAYEESLNIISWSIEKETKVFGNILCTRATCRFMGRDYIAWFAKDIPIFEGPYKFSRLPGLVVNIYDSKNHYNYTLLEFKTNTKHLMTVNKDCLKVSKKNFYKAEKDFYLNFSQSIESIPNLSASSIDPIAINKVIERYKKRNNPIELIHE